MSDRFSETDPATRPKMPIPCRGLVRRRMVPDEPEAQIPFRCDRCGARFYADLTYVEGSHGEPVRKEGLDMRGDQGICHCPVFSHYEYQ